MFPFVKLNVKANSRGLPTLIEVNDAMAAQN